VVDISAQSTFSDFTDDPSQPDSVGTVIVEIEDEDNSTDFLASEKLPWQGKTQSQAQIRQMEQNALREVILQQSTEILPDAECKKTRYVCNVCGHIAKSVKFMHNHLQVGVTVTLW
jgi:hypothetical protein